jgi:hypothetical protein
MFRQSGNLAQPVIANNLFTNTNQQPTSVTLSTAPPAHTGRWHLVLSKCQTPEQAFENA